MGRRSLSIEEKIERHSRRDHDTGCLIWTGALSERGYAMVQHEGCCRRAARLIYERAKGPIPGLVPDHLCKNRACIELNHLEAVTQRVNVLRGLSPALSRGQKKFVCDACGGPYEILSKGRRVIHGCRPCTAARLKEWRHAG
jgi:hypothetical protein